MKIRIKGNSVRYRLTKSEVEKFAQSGYLEERTSFPSGVFTYALAAKIGLETLESDFSAHKLTLFFPDSERENWFQSNRVGYEHLQQLPNGEQLFILLEKDFVCIDRPDEDQSDQYPNPNLNC